MYINIEKYHFKKLQRLSHRFLFFLYKTKSDIDASRSQCDCVRLLISYCGPA